MQPPRRPNESEAPPRIASREELERAKLLDETEDERTKPGKNDTMADAEHAWILRHFEQRVDELIADLKTWLALQLTETNTAIRQTCIMAERAANTGVNLVTLHADVEALHAELQTVKARCLANHGELLSVPPNGSHG